MQKRRDSKTWHPSFRSRPPQPNLFTYSNFKLVNRTSVRVPYQLITVEPPTLDNVTHVDVSVVGLPSAVLLHSLQLHAVAVVAAAVVIQDLAASRHQGVDYYWGPAFLVHLSNKKKHQGKH
jgi:hypothetical protein